MAKAAVARKELKRTPEGAISFESFQQPAMQFRPMPFWGLNDWLEDAELRRQIRQMKDHGWGGFFIHPRYGMDTPYLTPEFFSRIRTVIKEADSEGLNVWIYDEHPFPAGCSGGLVGAESRANRHKCLVMRVHNRLTPLEEGIAYFSMTTDHRGVVTDLRPIRDPKKYRGNDRLFLHLYQWTDPVQPSTHPGITNDFIHGFPYTDTLRPEAVRRFIELTYEGYRKSVGQSFGRTVKGMFSDVPVYQWHYATPRPSIPWTPKLPEYFRKHAGYDLVPLLPSLFFDVGEYGRVRHDFWRIVNQLFLESYTKQLYRWCETHGLQYTAHYWGEEALHWQVPWTGDVMSHFEWQHVVSIDHILRNIEDPLGIKQAASVAEQLGKARVISETYALCGHNLTYEERKWIGDWEYALGINFLVPYIPAYSMRGRRKRDEPPSEFFQQPYWRHEDILNDYYGRLSYVLSRGKQVVDILLLQPLATAWVLYRPNASQPAAYRPHPDPYEAAGEILYRYSQQYIDTCRELLRIHRDFHLGNETLLAEHAHVEGDCFRVGQCAYKAILIPPSMNWSETTVDLLRQFCAAGGKVLAMKPLPNMMDGRRKGEVLPEGVKVIGVGDSLADALNESLPPDVSIGGGEEIIYQHRRAGDDDIFFFTNTSMQQSYPQTRIRLSTERPLELWDAISGKRTQLPSSRENGSQSLQLDFAPISSYLLVSSASAAEDLPTYQPLPREFLRTQPLAKEWKLHRLDPNTLTLDYCELRINRSEWSARMPIWKAHLQVHEAGIGTAYQLRFCFDVLKPPKSLLLAIETPGRYNVSVNELPLRKKQVRRWFDPSLHLFDISGAVSAGQNTIVMSSTCALDTEIEACYLVGQFGVQGGGPFRLADEPTMASGRNLVKEGYPFFIGRMGLEQEFYLDKWSGRAFFRASSLDAIIATVKVNGTEAGWLAWKPYLVDITEFVHPGTNRFEIELCSSLHNLLGPHHDVRGEARHFVLQQSWSDAVHWTDDYFFVPFGVGDVEIAFSD